MEEKLLEVKEFPGPGYSPVVDFAGWRVAVLNFTDEINPKKIRYMERHEETDEVFVLQKGKGILFIGVGDSEIMEIQKQILEPGMIYNVKQKVWHTVILSTDGSVLIVENRNTSKENSSYLELDQKQIMLIVEISQALLPE
jgi:ureidoglycolate hydrolase